MSNPGPAEVTVRAARQKDVDIVLAIWQAAEAPPSPTDRPESIQNLIRRDPGALLVAEVGGEIVGSLIAGWDGWRGNLYRLAVQPGHRRVGVARRLVRAAVQRLQQKGAVRINAQVLRADVQATAFWSAVGFTQDPRMARFLARTGPKNGAEDGPANRHFAERA